jgi:cell division protein FtsL
MASLSHAQAAVVDPVARPRPRSRSRKRSQARARGGILWIVASGILLAGVVFVNVAVLQLNLSLDGANSDRSKLAAQNAALQSQLSTMVSSQRIQNKAVAEFGLTFKDPTTYGYVNVARP